MLNIQAISRTAARNSFRKRDTQPTPKEKPDPIEWIHKNFYLYDTGELVKLFPCQILPMRLALSRDENGNYIFNTVLWSWPKKSAKSSVIAAIADYTAEHKLNGSVKLIANDLKQADSRIGYYLRESIKMGQQRGLRQGVHVTPSGYRIQYPNGARLECVPIDPSGEAGGNDDLIVYSELWGWKSKAHQQMWTEMTLSPTKFGHSQRWIDTYAGIEGQSPILEMLYDTGVKNGIKQPEDDFGGAEVYINAAAKMLTVWVTKPLFPWQTPEYYAEQAATLTPQEMDRIHGNKWASPRDAFIPISWWDNCQVEALDPLDGRGVVMGIDAATENDCFAIVIVSMSRVNPGKAQLRYCRVWYPPEHGQIDYSDVKDEIRRLCKTYTVEEVCYDPYQMTSISQELGDLAFWNPFSQAGPRAVADKLLYDSLRDRQIEHDGTLPDMRTHIINADRKPEDDKLRIVKRTQKGKIDAVVAASMAVDRAIYYSL